MNDEIKEILDRIETASEIFDCLLKPEECTELLDYITNLQQAIKDTKDTADDMLYELKQENDDLKNRLENAVADCNLRLQENERLNNCIDDQERVINSLIDKRDLYKINYNDYKFRCEKAIEYINKNSYFKDNVVKTMIFKDYSSSLLNILQNGSDNNE